MLGGKILWDGFSYVTSSWLETASEDELRETASEMESLLDELDYDSDEHTQISFIILMWLMRFPVDFHSICLIESTDGICQMTINFDF